MHTRRGSSFSEFIHYDERLVSRFIDSRKDLHKIQHERTRGLHESFMRPREKPVTLSIDSFALKQQKILSRTGIDAFEAGTNTPQCAI